MFLGIDVTGSIVAGIIGAVVALLVERWLLRGKPSKTCPSCDAELPSHRKPSSLRQALMGGWTCRNCGAELDRHARVRG